METRNKETNPQWGVLSVVVRNFWEFTEHHFLACKM